MVPGVFSSFSFPGLGWDERRQVISMSAKFTHQDPFLLVEFPLESYLGQVQIQLEGYANLQLSLCYQQTPLEIPFQVFLTQNESGGKL